MISAISSSDSKSVADFRNFQLQVLALGMVPRKDLSLDEIWDKACKLFPGREVDLDDPRIQALWNDLRPETRQLNWPTSEYTPERGLQRRALLLGNEAVRAMEEVPRDKDIEYSNDWQHLFLHGKLGLMSCLFAFEQQHADVLMKDLAGIVDRFMDAIEKEFEQILGREDRQAFLRCLRLKDESLPFDDLIRGRLQPFSLARSLYYEGDFPDMRPLKWWVMHERFIPDLPHDNRHGA